MITITFLGTNGWYDSPMGSTICVLLESKEHYIILDAGFGIHKTDQYFDPKKKKDVSLFLSHFHLDHIVGLHTLNKFDFPGLRIFGQKGTRQALRTLLRPPYTFRSKDLSYPMSIHELKVGRHRIPFPVDCAPLLHSTPCMGYRFDIDGRSIAYCTDTGICDGLKELARDADLLILECSFLSGERSTDWPHMNPEDAAGIAKECKVGRLVLTHFDAARYSTVRLRTEAERNARKIFRNTLVAKDDMVLKM